MNRNKFLEKINAIFDRVLTGGLIFGSIIILLLMLVVTFDVILRYGFNTSWNGVEEVAEIVIIYAVMAGTAWVLKEDGHVGIDVFVTLMKPRGQVIARSITSITGAIVCALLAFCTSISVIQQLDLWTYDMRTLNIPFFWYMLPIPFAMLLLCYEFIRKSVKYIQLSKRISDEFREQKDEKIYY